MFKRKNIFQSPKNSPIATLVEERCQQSQAGHGRKSGGQDGKGKGEKEKWEESGRGDGRREERWHLQ